MVDTIKDYTTGKIVEDIKYGLSLVESNKETLANSEIGEAMLAEVNRFEPKIFDITEVSKLIQGAEKCAVGERTCRALLPDSTLTESVFLDELADALVDAGHANWVTKEEAISTLGKYKSKIIVSKISGKYMEICRTYSKTCIFWNMEKCGLKCIER